MVSSRRFTSLGAVCCRSESSVGLAIFVSCLRRQKAEAKAAVRGPGGAMLDRAAMAARWTPARLVEGNSRRGSKGLRR